MDGQGQGAQAPGLGSTEEQTTRGFDPQRQPKAVSGYGGGYGMYCTVQWPDLDSTVHLTGAKRADLESSHHKNKGFVLVW